MRYFVLRCKHCQKEYTYCTYGNGPIHGTEEGCSMEYCAECQKAIDDALGKIPVKFRHEFVPIDEPQLYPVFQGIKDAAKNEIVKNFSEGICFPSAFRLHCCGDYDNIDEYVHKGILYRVEWNDYEPDNLHVSVDMEYDIENKTLTGKPWKCDENDSYRHGRNSSKDLSRTFKNSMHIAPMEGPTGLLFFNDCIQNIDFTEYIPCNKNKKEHILRSYTYCQTGKAIKTDARVGHGADNKKIIFDDGIDVEKLIDFIEYEYTVEEYEDENVVYYKGIHVK